MPSVEKLREALDYDPVSGLFKWRTRPAHHFQSEIWCRRWNTKFAGKPAFRQPTATGYFEGTFENRRLYAHRVAYALENGEWPAAQVDHIDGNRKNNCASNLRPVTNADNARNMRRSSANKSGRTGVYWREGRRCWVASIKADGRTKHLGCFEEMQEAVLARQNAERELGFHANHGA